MFFSTDANIIQYLYTECNSFPVYFQKIPTKNGGDFIYSLCGFSKLAQVPVLCLLCKRRADGLHAADYDIADICHILRGESIAEVLGEQDLRVGRELLIAAPQQELNGKTGHQRDLIAHIGGRGLLCRHVLHDLPQHLRLVTIGEGAGDNWWCVLFPPLCLLEAEESTDVEYTSYVKELIEKYI